MPRLVKAASLLLLAGCLGAFVAGTRRWPPISDGVLMRYVWFLTAHGMAPYRDITDPNMPGAYLQAALIEQLFGRGSLAFRLADLASLAPAAVAFLLLGGRRGRYPALVAAAVFALLHGADGAAQMNQRDFAMAVLSFFGTAVFLRAMPDRDRAQTAPSEPLAVFWGILAGFCWGAACTLKPQIALLPALILALAFRRRAVSAVFSAAAAVSVPPLAVLFWLYRQHALRAFFRTAVGLVPFHASMARHSLLFLAGHAVASPVLPLLLAAAILFAVQRGWRTLREQALLAGMLVGFVSYVLQGKGYPYHRSTLLLFLLAYLASRLEQALAAPGPRVRACAAAVVASMVLWLAPASAVRAVRLDWRTMPSLDSLTRDLQAEGAGSTPGSQAQCMDTMAGCISALDRLGLVQSTGFLYDCYFFAPAATRSQQEVQAALRSQFWQEITARPPLLFVVTEQWCLNLPGGYGKLSAWPQFAQLLGERYTLREVQPSPVGSFRNRAAWPFGYRIYRRLP